MKTYIIEFQRAEQYDEACNCKPRSFAKAFDEITTLSENYWNNQKMFS